jgi:hypothetical protein
VSDIEEDINGLRRSIERLASAQEYRNINLRQRSRAHLFGSGTKASDEQYAYVDPIPR